MLPLLLTGLGASALLYVLSRTDKGSIAVANLTDAIAKLPRGIRNNNPGNIRRGKDVWQGMSASQTDPDYVQFEGPDARWGVRALARILLSYEKQGRRTVASIIERWAPATENNTASYVQAVARKLAVNPDQVIDVREYLGRLAEAIIQHENGQQPYSISDIHRWVKL